jgi:hypothetical protein
LLTSWHRLATPATVDLRAELAQSVAPSYGDTASQHLRKNEVAAYARCPPLPLWTLRARETQEVVMVGLPKPGDIQKMLDGFHKELGAIRTLLEQLLELERERIERDQAA